MYGYSFSSNFEIYYGNRFSLSHLDIIIVTNRPGF